MSEPREKIVNEAKTDNADPALIKERQYPDWGTDSLTKNDEGQIDQEIIKIDSNGQWKIEKAEKLAKPAPKGVSEEKYDDCVDQVKQEGGDKNAYAICGASLKKDDMPHPPGSPQDEAHDVIELDKDLQSEMKDLDDEGKREMLAHLRSYKDNPKKWKRSKKNIKAGDEKDEPGRD